MSPIIYFVADLYPWWGIPIALIFAEVANTHRRRGERKKMAMYLSVSFIFFSLAVVYFVLNGFEKLRPAMEQLERTILNK
ncbi:MAG: hypothetical protein ACXWP1_01600 [Bdellovibrionota bacterium]